MDQYLWLIPELLTTINQGFSPAKVIGLNRSWAQPGIVFAAFCDRSLYETDMFLRVNYGKIPKLWKKGGKLYSRNIQIIGLDMFR